LITLLFTSLALICAADSLVRGVLFVRGRKASSREAGPGSAVKLLVVVPARGEGVRVAPAIASAAGAEVLLLLDGADAEAETAAFALGAKVITKEPAGPTKGAALAWLANEHASVMEPFDAVLILDVGSALAPGFFERFRWPAGADAVQAHLEGGSGGAADSERFAQTYLDRGRESIGWNARLRGTGSAFRVRTFLEVAAQLETRVEDLEASLLLHQATIRMGPPDAIVFDQKPAELASSALQRARWLVGRYELLVLQVRPLGAAVAHRPLEGLAFVAEIFGHPLSLTVPFRIVTAAFLVSRGHVAMGSAIAGSTVIDAALLMGRTSPGAAMRLAASWLLAAALAPRALMRWTRVERP
jgi:hypothetical protein